ncbi:interaptin [Cavenderia fasciculata]|uniref:Interaptin n=1 Tax=Cavenderia fasciculata TaxID=261658 RepID=F4PGS2_CACFS|nr:interaptin [Cavenderia fasciculata]EGG24906.1 interaptin [Cavenderia fasciculata]|eukprot:XP_004362757.1 interaptin [Cavenderia fasciculata]
MMKTEVEQQHQQQINDINKSSKETKGTDGWVLAQKKVFTNWCNIYLGLRELSIKDVQLDLEDGILLANLLEVLSGSNSILSKCTKLKNRLHKVNNINFSLKFIAEEGIKMVGCGAEDIADGNLKLIMGLIWTLIKSYQIQSLSLSLPQQQQSPQKINSLNGSSQNLKQFVSANEVLLQWTRTQLQDYNNIVVNDFTKSFQNGIVFCSLIHKLIPEAIDINSLNPDQALENLQLAFDTAKQALGIPSILEAKDIIEEPDELCIITYLSLFPKVYQKFLDPTVENKRFSVSLTPTKRFNNRSSQTLNTTDINNSFREQQQQDNQQKQQQPLALIVEEKQQQEEQEKKKKQQQEEEEEKKKQQEEEERKKKEQLEKLKQQQEEEEEERKKQLEKLEQEHSDQLNTLNQRIESLEKSLDQKEKEKEAKMTELQDQREFTAEFLKEILDLKNTLSNGVNLDSEQLSQFEASLKENDKLLSDLASAQDRQLVKDGTINSLKSIIEEKDRRLQELQTKAASLASADEQAQILRLEFEELKSKCQCQTLVIVLRERVQELERLEKESADAKQEQDQVVATLRLEKENMINEHSEQVNQLKQRLQERNSEREESKQKELEELHGTIDQLKGTISDLQREVSSEKGKWDTLNQSGREQREELEKEIEQLKQQTNNMLADKQEALKEKEGLETRLAEALAAQQGNWKEIIQEKEKANEALQAKIESIHQLKTTAIDQLQEERLKLLAEVEQVKQSTTQQLNDKLGSIEQLSQEKGLLLTELEETKKSSNQQLQEKITSFEQLQQKTDQLVEEKSKLIVEMDQVRQTSSQELVGVQNQLDSLSKKYDTLNQQHTSLLQQQSSNTNDTISLMSQQLSQLTTRYDQLESENVNLAQTNKDLENKIEQSALGTGSLQKKLEHISKQFAGLDDRNQHLARESEDKTAQIRDISIELHNITIKYDTLQSNYQRMVQDHSMEREQLNLSTSDLENKYGASLKEINLGKSLIGQADEKNESLSNNLKQLEEKYNNLTTQFNNLQQKLKDQQDKHILELQQASRKSKDDNSNISTKEQQEFESRIDNLNKQLKDREETIDKQQKLLHKQQQNQQQNQPPLSTTKEYDILEKRIMEEVAKNPQSSLQRVYRLANEKYFVNSKIVNITVDKSNQSLLANSDDMAVPVPLSKLFLKEPMIMVNPNQIGTTPSSSFSWKMLLFGGIFLALFYGYARPNALTRPN